MRIKVVYTKRVDIQNWTHGSRTVKADTYEEAERIVREELVIEGVTILCVSAIRGFTLEGGVVL